MIARPVTRPPRSCSGPRLRAAFRLRLLSVALLLLALGGVLLLPVAHAGPHGYSLHHDVAAAAMAQPCPHAHGPGDGAAADHCDPDPAGPGLFDCCQACLAAAILPETQALPPSPENGHLGVRGPDRQGRIPAGILRPPRPIATA
ncbi:hypothetical protein [Paracoccus versutus]|nr:hypothetical protein SAMN04244548_02788 [Paracoccus pantotrophus]